MAVMSSLDRAREVLKEVFGFEDFLDGQEVVIGDILSGQDGSVVMPTGGGKSLCYQLPADHILKQGCAQTQWKTAW